MFQLSNGLPALERTAPGADKQDHTRNRNQYQKGPKGKLYRCGLNGLGGQVDIPQLGEHFVFIHRGIPGESVALLVASVTRQPLRLKVRRRSLRRASTAS